MAFSRRGGADINVTPLIDVLLVLLVIFIVVMPNLQLFESVQTPTDDGSTESAALVVRVRADLSVVLVDEGREIELDAGSFPAGLRAHLRETTHVVYVELEQEVLWGHVVSTVDTIRGVAPMTQVALMVPED